MKSKELNQTTANSNNVQSPKKKSQGLFGSLFSSGKSSSAGSKTVNIPKTVQETIPYYAVYQNGIIETKPGTFSKSYAIEDVNFKIATMQEQENIFSKYSELLNSLGNDVKGQITIFNRNVDKDKFYEDVLMPYKHDSLDTYREESNSILISHMNEGRNNLMREKYFSISLEADNIDVATAQFARLDTEISASIKKINGCDSPALTAVERLSILHDLYNLNSDTPLYSKLNINGKDAESFSLELLGRQGITTKDAIAPSSITFNADHIIIDDKYARVLFLEGYPSFLSTDFITDITDIACNMITSVFYEPISQDKSMKIINNQMVNINANVIEAQKKAAKSGYSPDLISPELLKAQEEASKLREDMTSRNQKLFYVSFLIVHFADSLDELNEFTKTIQSTGQKYLCTIKKLTYQQEPGFASALPLAQNKLHIKRMLTTESSSVFIPFSAQELAQERGMYYGLNAVSHNLLLFNRLNSDNANGIILGTSGSGKSFAAKREMINVLLATDDDVYVIDPEREYSPIAKMFNGEVVKIAPGSKVYINPLDMDLQYADDDDPITLKSDFIGSLCETVIGGRYGLSPVQKSVIDRCVRLVYQPYLEYLASLKDGTTYDKDHAPTLVDFYELLLAQPEPEAQNIALSLELYCTGSLDTFAYRSNVNTSSRFVVYDIKDIGSGMKEMGLQVCLNDIWNKIIANKQKHKRTWFYIDEFYLLTQTDSSALFLQQVYKRARKWGGVPTGITQNVEDLLSSKEARGIINNCSFIMMLNQSPLDRQELGAMLNISPAQMSYITNADVGQGLLYTGKSIIPFIDKYPTNTRTFKAMTTKLDDVIANSNSDVPVYDG